MPATGTGHIGRLGIHLFRDFCHGYVPQCLTIDEAGFPGIAPNQDRVITGQLDLSSGRDLELVGMLGWIERF